MARRGGHIARNHRIGRPIGGGVRSRGDAPSRHGTEPLSGPGIVISRRLWQTEFRAKADIHGEHLRIDGVDVRVSDVAPDWLEGVYRDRPVDVWTALLEDSLEAVENDRRNLWVLGRLRPNVSTDQAQFPVRVTHRRPVEIRVVPYAGMTPEMAEDLSRVGTLLSFAAVLVFFIACVNVASFLLGRASARSQETSVRVALGASRCQLTQGLLADSLVISAAGGALGGLLAMWISRVLPALLFEQDATRLVAASDAPHRSWIRIRDVHQKARAEGRVLSQ